MNDILNSTKEKMNASIESMEKRFNTVRTGRANPSSLNGVMVEYYGAETPLKQLVTISVPEGNQLLIKPFDKSCINDIVKAITAANLGYNPTTDGETIRIIVPALTEERRVELTKQVRKIAEDAKISIRNERHDALDKIKKDEEVSEDEEKHLEKEVQTLVDDFNKKVENLLKEKEEELMTV